MRPGKRPYSSQRRQAQAEATRRLILAAARTLFTDRGYTASTIEAVAGEAGVAVQTVYASFGTKRDLLFALLDQMASEADVSAFQQRLNAATGDPRLQLREGVAFNTRLYSGGADLIELARTVAGVEADLGAMWREGEARRYRAESALVAQWNKTGALAPGLTESAARDIFWAFSGPDLFRLLVIERRWSRTRYQEWLSTTLEGLLLR